MENVNDSRDVNIHVSLCNWYRLATSAHTHWMNGRVCVWVAGINDIQIVGANRVILYALHLCCMLSRSVMIRKSILYETKQRVI